MACEDCSDEVAGDQGHRDRSSMQGHQTVVNVSTKRVDGGTPVLKRFLNCSSVSCGASGGVLEIETITTTFGTLYNGITDVYTRINNLYTTSVAVAGTAID